MKYDLLLVGAGLFNATIAQLAVASGKKVLVIEKRGHIGGNCYTEEIEGIQVHRYGAHIFHTDDKQIWDYVNQFAEFNRYTNCPIANYQGRLYNLPFNMNTFTKMWSDVLTPDQATARIAQQSSVIDGIEPQNLEEQAISLVGKDIYERLVKGYTEKQWGRPCSELPPFIIQRLPVRYTFDNNYFNDRYQGIPIGGYTCMMEKMFEGSEVMLNVDFHEYSDILLPLVSRTIYTGPIDRYFEYQYGELEYRSLRFETEVLDTDNFQGNAVINYTDAEIPFTRIIEHKHFEWGQQSKTVITREYPVSWKPGNDPYYAVMDERNLKLYEKYKVLAGKQHTVIFGGRLGMYRYYDMDEIITEAFKLWKALETSE